MTKYQDEVTAIHTLSESTHLHSVNAGVVIPLLQSLVTGVLVAVVAGLIAYWDKMPAGLFWSLLFGVGSILFYWLQGLRLWSYLVRLVEREVSVDLDGDGVIGEPEPEKTIRVEVTESNSGYPQTKIITLPQADKLPELCSGLLAGKPFAESVWCGQTAGKPFSVPQFRELRRELLQRGLLEQRNPQNDKQGYVLTRGGLAFARRMAEELPSPVSSLDDTWTKRG